MRPAEFATPGELRDQILAAVLSGAKTATTSLLAEYEPFGEELPRPGERFLILDSAGEGIGVLETADVRVIPFGAVDDAFARDEGEGFADAAAYREAHLGFWNESVVPAIRERLGDPRWQITLETPVVAERFRLVERFDQPQARD